MSDILFAEDDADVRKWVGYAVRTVEDGEAALAACATKRPDVLILDVMMPKRDGLSVCSEIRRMDPELPILMLTARNTERDKVTGLGAGADDYMTKPFGMEELFARIAALLRRARLLPRKTKERPSFRIGQHEVAGVRLVLRASHRGEVLRRDQILDEIWGVTFYGNTRTLDQHIALVRRKLGDDAVLLETIRNVGYRLSPA